MIVFYIIWSIMWCSVCEWALHRYIMHKPVWKLRYPYERHALTHHTIFKADESYHLLKEEDKKTIPMAWWNGIVIASLSSLPVLLVFGFYGFVINFVVSMCYYGVYETLHWYMHLPRKRKIEYRTWYRKLNGHHILHHRYTNKNFNVVLPLADLLFGTIITRSLISFNQAKPSYCVPDLQPK